VTAFTTYAQCPKKFYWTYERPLPRKSSFAARLGTIVHQWIERQGTGAITLVEPEDYEVRTPAEASEVAHKRDVFRATRYYGRIIDHIEQPFALVVGGHAIQGRIDAIYRDGDKVEIVDWKTGSAPGDSVGGEGWQLECYALAVQEMWGIPPENITATFVYLGGDEAVESSITVRPAAEIRAGLEATLDQIAARAFEPTPNPKCGSCDFLAYCEVGRASVAARDTAGP
jgi:DNA helicase II / ATP-dependent DNA helicase PcrA